MKDEQASGFEVEVEMEPAEKSEEAPEESEASGYETPEEAMEKALAEGDPSQAIERLRHCGYELKKIDEAPTAPSTDDAGKRRLDIAKKALAKFGMK